MTLEEKENYRKEQEVEHAKCKEKGAERAFELGVFYIMGMGIPKDIQKGLDSIRDAAELGSSRARNTYLCLLDVYDSGNDDRDGLARKWFIDESQKQVDPYFLDFKSREPSIFKEIQEGRRLNYYQKGRRVLSYKDDVAPILQYGEPRALASANK